ncbi:MAG: ATPase, T2SS/T4P/T4SS family, partial [Planctomycetota bacterium]
MSDRDVRSVRSLFARKPAAAPPSIRSTAAPASSETARATDDYVELKARLHARMVGELQEDGLLGADPAELSVAVENWVADVLDDEVLPLNEGERQRLAHELTEEATGLGPLGPLLADPAITDILVNGHDQVFIERYGRLERVAVRFADDEHLRRMIERLALGAGRRIDQSSPMVDLRLKDGSRVNATLPPVSIDGPTLSIRRFGRNRLRSADVLKLGMLDAAMWTVLSAAVKRRQNVLLSGGTGAGKSTRSSAGMASARIPSSV